MRLVLLALLPGLVSSAATIFSSAASSAHTRRTKPDGDASGGTFHNQPCDRIGKVGQPDSQQPGDDQAEPDHPEQLHVHPPVRHRAVGL